MHKQERRLPKQFAAQAIHTLKREWFSDSIYPESVCNIFEALDCPLSLSAWLLFKYKEHDQLVNMGVNPRDFLDADSFQRALAAVSLLKKNETLQTSYDLEKEAIRTFNDMENHCKEMNVLLPAYIATYPESEKDIRIHKVITTMRRKIRRILGRFDIDNVLHEGGWGPGSTTLVKGSDTSSFRKFASDTSVTAECQALYGSVLIQAFPNWASLKNATREIGCKVCTVPKNAKTNRTIAIEPGINSWIQHGIGKVIRRKLRSFGYDLNSDVKNQQGARRGSLDDSLATMDFSSASDSLSIALVELNLPPVWFSCLDSARSHYYHHQEEWHVSSKFSTMGNGFTFELESLIFLALALSCCEVDGVPDSDVSVFGDDLIIPKSVVDLFTSVSQVLGLKVNSQKSYSDSDFRESCGSYWFKGCDVKPIYLREESKRYRIEQAYKLLNMISLLASRLTASHYRDACLKKAWYQAFRRIPEPLRLLGPVHLGDTIIHTDEEAPPSQLRGGIRSWKVTSLQHEPLGYETDHPALLLSRLSSFGDRSYGNRIVYRKRTRLRIKFLRVYSWQSLGNWI